MARIAPHYGFPLGLCHLVLPDLKALCDLNLVPASSPSHKFPSRNRHKLPGQLERMDAADFLFVRQTLLFGLFALSARGAVRRLLLQAEFLSPIRDFPLPACDCV